MNDNHSGAETAYLDRWVTASFLRAVKTYRVVVLTGARQTGKSTFLRHAPQVKNWEYITLDDFDALDAAEKDPDDLLAGKNRLIIDEVQKAPRLLSSIKRKVDTLGKNARFILSGSANLLLMHKVSESLAGRAVYHLMRPLTLGETKSQKANSLLDSLISSRPLNFAAPRSKIDLENIILRGFLPPAVVQFKSLSAVLGWMEGYITTFLERDLRQLAQIDNLSDFRRLMGILALRSGQMLNQSEISRDAGVPQPTAHRYLNLMETSFLLEKVPAYAVSRTKRLIKTPKVYWFDCGLAAFLMGLHHPKDLRGSREWGALMETLVLQHLKVWASLKTPSPRIFYWRTVAGQEVDFIIEDGKNLLAVEVKASAGVKYSDAENLKTFLSLYPKTTAGIIVYAGREFKQIGEKLWAVPWELLI